MLLHHSVLAFLDHTSQSDDVGRSHYSWISDDASSPRVQRDRVGPCGFGVEAALLLPAPGDGRASAVFLDIQRGLELWLVQTSEPKGRAAGAAKTFGASLQARVSSSKSHALTRCST